jgi:16S rRNA (cytosine1402-N4)-methyltransferase
MSEYHEPVLLEQVVSSLIRSPDGIYVDATFGGGGHARAILSKLSSKGKLLAFDHDPDSARNVPDDTRLTFIPHNFKHLKRFLQYHQGVPADGIFADLGVSSYQFDTPARGFSYRFDGKLDMRMNPTRGVPACDIVNHYSETQLSDLFYTYGEMPDSRAVARRIVMARANNPLLSTTDLVNAVTTLWLPHKRNGQLSRLFQSLRIEVNGELEALREFLQQSTEVLSIGGRLAVISYHSLEDRLVKHFARAGKLDGDIEKDFYGVSLSPFRPVNRKPIEADRDEIERNPRARSAKLRIAEKIK